MSDDKQVDPTEDDDHALSEKEWKECQEDWDEIERQEEEEEYWADFYDDDLEW